MSGMLGMSEETDKHQARADLNEDGNFWNGGNVGISGMSEC